MHTETHITQQQQNRLDASLMVLVPRMAAITSEFCHLVELADPNLRLMFPSDEREIAPVIEQVICTVIDIDQAAGLMHTMGQQGYSSSIQEQHLPTLLAAIQTAIAETAGYTWTDQLEQDWTCWFNALTSWAIQGAEHMDSMAA